MEDNILDKIVKKYSLNLLLLFGSRVSGKYHKKSDFDVAYLSEAELNLEQESGLIFDLSRIFKNDNIDLVNLKNAKPLLYYAIFNDCRLLYEKTPLSFHSLRAYAFKKYIETKPLYEEKFKKLEAKIISM